MTNAEWIEYYRFHPSEFDSFIKFIETEFAKNEAELADSKAAEAFAANIIKAHAQTMTMQDELIAQLNADLATANTAASANMRMATKQAAKVRILKDALADLYSAFEGDGQPAKTVKGIARAALEMTQ